MHGQNWVESVQALRLEAFKAWSNVRNLDSMRAEYAQVFFHTLSFSSILKRLQGHCRGRNNPGAARSERVFIDTGCKLLQFWRLRQYSKELTFVKSLTGTLVKTACSNMVPFIFPN